MFCIQSKICLKKEAVVCTYCMFFVTELSLTDPLFSFFRLFVCFLYVSLQYISTTRFQICVKELFVLRFDPVTVSYVTLAGN